MKTIKLIRQSQEELNMDLLESLRSSLEALIYSDIDFCSEEWHKMRDKIIDFQVENGSFNLLDTFQVESDCRVYYCYESTYICTALLMKTHLEDRDFFAGNQNILARALEMCCDRGLRGHGYDAFCGQIKALDYFIRCDVNEFLNLYPDLSPKFTGLIEDIKRIFALRSQNKHYYESWGENYSEDILRIDAYFKNERYVFVYGTLMKGQKNHDAFLKEGQYIGAGTIEGYDIYDLGYYPGIIVGTDKVIGEVYRVDEDTERTLDRLEDEGSLFIKTPVNVRMDDGANCASVAYVYNRSVKGCTNIVGRYGI